MLECAEQGRKFKRAAGAERMPDYRFGGANQQVLGMVAKGLLDGKSFALVIERGTGAMGIDIVDLIRLNACRFKRSSHG